MFHWKPWYVGDIRWYKRDFGENANLYQPSALQTKGVLSLIHTLIILSVVIQWDSKIAMQSAFFAAVTHELQHPRVLLLNCQRKQQMARSKAKTFNWVHNAFLPSNRVAPVCDGTTINGSIAFNHHADYIFDRDLTKLRLIHKTRWLYDKSYINLSFWFTLTLLIK